MHPYSKAEIITAIHTIFDKVTTLSNQIENDIFFDKPTEKWSISEHLDHLRMSGKIVGKALSYPRIALWWKFGRANRPSRTSDKIKQRYTERLAQGIPSNNPFVSKIFKDNKIELLNSWENTKKLLTKNTNAWSEKCLDNYVVPHPLLGKMTLREILLFTIFHTEMHLITMTEMYEKAKK